MKLLYAKKLYRFFLEKYNRFQRKLDIKQFDSFRGSYKDIKFIQRKSLANKWLKQYPEQAHFNFGPVDQWLKKTVPVPANIIEIGGWRGDLALKALSSCNHIKVWHNYDLLEFNEYQKCNDERYRLITLDDYLWNKSPNYNYNALIATHMIEHISWKELTKLIKWIPQEIRTVLFEAPIPRSAENINWKGDHSSHVLEKGWEQVICEMKNCNFSLDYSEDNSYIFIR